jgi:aconitate hydratase
VASAETLAYAVAAGEIGDPRLFKRPVRVTVPRVLPTDDVLIVREKRANETPAKKVAPPSPLATNGVHVAWKGAETLEIVDAATFFGRRPSDAASTQVAVVCTTLDQVRHLSTHAAELSGRVRAVLAPFIPSGLVSLLSAGGIAALQLDAANVKHLKDEKSLALPAPQKWAADRSATVVPVGKSKVALTWLASVVERGWTGVGTARPPAKDATARRA